MGKAGRLVSTQAGSGTAASSAVRYIFEHYPHIARRAGRSEFHGRLPEVVPHPVDELDALLAEARAELAALPESADPELRADLDAAVHILGNERFPAAELGQPWPGPLVWLGTTDVSDYPSATHVPLDERMSALHTHLAGLPGLLEQAADTIAPRLRAGERLIGVEYARAQAMQLEDVGRDVVRAHPGHAADDISVAATAAATACRRYGNVIEQTEPANLLYGPELLGRFLHVTQGLDHPVDELVEEVAEEVASLVARLDRLAAGLGAANRDAAFALLRQEVSAAPVPDVLTAAIDRLRRFWAEADVVSVDTVVPLEVRRAPRLSGAARATFTVSAPLLRDRPPHILWIPESDADAAAGEVRTQFLNDPMLEVIAVHEGFAGHYIQFEAASRGPSELRTCVPWFPAFTEGWAHYVEELAVEWGLAADRPLVEVAQLKLALEAATRALVFLSVHTGRMSFAAAVAKVIELCGWSAERAAREVVIVAADPGGAMYTLGKLRIRAWRRELGPRPARAALKHFHDRLAACGCAPLSTVLRYYHDGRRPDAAPSTPAYTPARS